VAGRIVVEPGANGDWVAWSLDVAAVRVVAATADLARTKAAGQVARRDGVTSGVEVAVKVLRSERARHVAHYITRFAAEARALAQVDSAHVPRVHAAGFDVDAGTPYIVMDLVRGPTLAALRRGAGVPLADALVIAAQTARALGDLAAAGVIDSHAHDGNVMIDVGDVVKVIDLDRAKLVPAPALAIDLRALAALVRALVPRDKVSPALRLLLERLSRGAGEDARDVALELEALATKQRVASTGASSRPNSTSGDPI
jgi:serine/threonine protein kinase